MTMYEFPTVKTSWPCDSFHMSLLL